MRPHNQSTPDLMARRGSCLALGMALQFMLGINYAFSVFQLPLMEEFNVSLSTISLIPSLAGVCAAFYSLFLAAKFREILGFRKLVIVGSFLFGMSFFTAGLNPGTSVFCLFLSLLFLRAVSCLMVDIPIKSYAVELYPDRSGRASGLTTAAYGAAAIVWAPLVTALITRVGDLSATFLIIGAALSILMVAASLPLIEVPADFSQRFRRSLTIETPDQYYNVNRTQLMHLPVFYLLLGSLMFAMASGNALLTQFAYYMEALLHTSAETAALSVSALALANMLGRLLFGTVADRIGMLNTTLIAQVLSAAALFGCAAVSSPVGFTAAAMVVIFCFGGIYSLLSPLNAEIFGHRHMTENFPIIITIANLAVLLGPMAASVVVDRTGSLSLTMLTCTVMGTAGALLMLLITRKLKRVQKNVSGSNV